MTEQKSSNVVWHESRVDRTTREDIFGQKGVTLWFTGLSGSGKSTLAFTLEHLLIQRGYKCYVLDGDNVRFGLNRDLGFSPEDRTENIRRIGEVCRLFQDAGLVVLTAFISPYQTDRDQVRALHGPGQFVEVFVDTPIEVCEARDVKGLYAKARAGDIPEFSGISAPYEAPTTPEIRVDTSRPIDECVTHILEQLGL